MPKLEQLAGRTRKPVAVILSAIMAMSGVPMVPFAQQVSAAYAEEQAAEPTEGKGSYANSATVTDLDGALPTVTFDAHPGKGDGAGTLTISHEAIETWLLQQDAVKAIGMAATYTKNGADNLSKQVDELLADEGDDSIRAGIDAKDPVRSLKKDTLAVTTFSASAPSAVEFEAVTSNVPDGAKVSMNEDGDVTVSVSKDAQGDEVSVPVAFKVTGATFGYTFDYTYQLETDKTKVEAIYGEKGKEEDRIHKQQKNGSIFSSLPVSKDGKTITVAFDVKNLKPWDEEKKGDEEESTSYRITGQQMQDAVNASKTVKAMVENADAGRGDEGNATGAAVRSVLAGAEKAAQNTTVDNFYDYANVAGPESLKGTATAAFGNVAVKAGDKNITIEKVENDYRLTVTGKEEKPELTAELTDVNYSASFAYDMVYTANTDKAVAYFQGQDTDLAAGTGETSGTFEADKSFGTVAGAANQSKGEASFVNYWKGVSESIATEVTAANDMTFGDTEPFTETLFNAKEGLVGKVNNSKNAKYFDVAAPKQGETGAYTVSLTPKNAFVDGVKTFTVAWSYPDGTQAGTTTVTVNKIDKKQVDLSTAISLSEPLPFRMADDGKQLDAIKDAINKAVAAYVKDENSKVSGDHQAVDAYLKKVASIDNTDDYYKAQESAVTLAGDAYTVEPTAADEVENFVFATNEDGTVKMPVVTIEKMETEDWSKSTDASPSSLKLKASALKGETTLTGASAKNTWVRTEPAVTWEGGKVASQNIDRLTAGEMVDSFSDKTTFEAGMAQGLQRDAFFVRDNETGVVRRIDNVSYRYDSAKPGLTALDAVPHGREFTSSDGKVWAAENMDVEFVTSEGDENDTSSGINKVDASYTEAGSGKSATVKDIDNMGSTGKDADGGYKYGFSINADSKVSSDSITIDLQDRAGNENNGLTRTDAATNIQVAELMANTSAPQIVAAWSTTDAHNGKYYDENRTLTLTVTAPFFEYTQDYRGDESFALIYRNGELTNAVKPGDFKKTGADTWQCVLNFTEDADWEVRGAHVSDILGRTATAAGADDVFTIDKTAPTMQVTFDNNDVANGKYYAAARTATITVTEHNFDPSLVNITPTASAGNGGEVGQPSISGWSANGDVHTATVTFPGQGVYTLSIDGMDLATNALTSYTCPEFVVDTLKPEIEIADVENHVAYADTVTPGASIHDTNLDGNASSIEVTAIGYNSAGGASANPFTAAPSTTATDMTVGYSNPMRLKENDGVFTLMVKAQDLAGNTDTQAVTWSVNRFGSTYVISDATGKMLDEYLKSSKLVDVQVTEINPSGILRDETNVVELTRDTKNTTLDPEHDYTVKAGNTSGWSEYTYTVKKGAYEEKDGVYRVLFHSQDVAGNISENTMEGKNASDGRSAAEVNFAVDDTKPTVSFANLSPEAGKSAIEEDERVGKVTFDDNLKLDHAEIKVDGKTVATFDAEDLEKSPVQEVKLTQSTSEQTVSAVVYDAAGNKSDDEDSQITVLLTTDALTLWLRNTPLMVGTIVAVAAVIGGAFYLVWRRRKNYGEQVGA